MTGPDSFDLIVIGAGPGGDEVVASRLGDVDLRIALGERELIGGECGYWPCMPTKTLLRPPEVRAEAGRTAGTSTPDQRWSEIAADALCEDGIDVRAGVEVERVATRNGRRVVTGGGALGGGVGSGADHRRRGERHVLEEPAPAASVTRTQPWLSGRADARGLRRRVDRDPVAAAPALDRVRRLRREREDAAPVGSGGSPVVSRSVTAKPARVGVGAAGLSDRDREACFSILPRRAGTFSRRPTARPSISQFGRLRGLRAECRIQPTCPLSGERADHPEPVAALVRRTHRTSGEPNSVLVVSVVNARPPGETRIFVSWRTIATSAPGPEGSVEVFCPVVVGGGVVAGFRASGVYELPVAGAARTAVEVIAIPATIGASASSAAIATNIHRPRRSLFLRGLVSHQPSRRVAALQTLSAAERLSRFLSPCQKVITASGHLVTETDV